MQNYPELRKTTVWQKLERIRIVAWKKMNKRRINNVHSTATVRANRELLFSVV